MIVTQSKIDQVLTTLKDLLGQIVGLRDRVTEFEEEIADELNQAQKEYEESLGLLNAEAAQLRYQKATLKARLAQLQSSQNPSDMHIPIAPDVPDIAPPEPTLSLETPNLPEPPPVDPRIVQKRALANHIYYFSDPDQEAVIQQINAVLKDESTSVGEILELLSWGDIWKARADWETMEQQYQRLKGWQLALETRLNYWKGEVQRFESESRYSLWEIKSHGEEHWQKFLDEVIEKQKTENDQLAHDIVVLKQELQAFELGEEMHE